MRIDAETAGSAFVATGSAAPAAAAPTPASETSRWLARGGLAVVDQFLQSGANFGLSILLARTLQDAAYGLYALSLAAFLLLATLYQGAVLVPATLLAATRFAGRQQQFFGRLLVLHAWFLALCVATLGCGAVALSLAGVDARVLAGPALALPGVLLYWLARTCCYVTYQSGRAVVAAAIYAVVLFAVVIAAAKTGVLSVFWGFAAMSLAGFAAGGFLLVLLLRRRQPAEPQAQPVTTAEVLREGWQIGRWELAVASAIWIPANLCYPLTASVLGAAATGQLRALQNFVVPMAQGLSGVLRLAQPYFSARAGEGSRESIPAIWRLALIAMAGAFLYLAAVTVFREPLMGALYRGKFAEAVPLLPWMVLSGVLAAGVESLAVGLRALRGSRQLLGAYAFAAVIYAAGGVPLARAAGLPGVVALLVLASAATLLASAYYLRKLSAERAEAAR